MTRFGALTWGWKIRWPNIIHVFLIWYGAIWLAAESLGAFDKDRYSFLQSPDTLWLAVIISLVASLWRNRFHTLVTFRLPTTNSEIAIKFQDLFLEPGMRLIPVNEFFDGQLGAHVSASSLHGQLIAREFQTNAKEFNAEIASALTGVSADFTSRTTGNPMRYEIGTTAQLIRGVNTYLLFALSRTNLDTLEATSDLPTFITAMQAVWRAVRAQHNGLPVVVPFEIEQAILPYEIPIIAAYPGFNSILSPRELRPLWPDALANGIDSGRASVMAPASQRDEFVAWTFANDRDLHARLLIPESFSDWKDFNTYSDLLVFEEDLAYLTSAVVIFLEGHGAIAELGAFSQIGPLKQRLVVVVEDQYHEKSSFISLGPLRQLDLRKDNQVCVIPTRNPKDLASDIDAVLHSLNSKRTADVRGSLNIDDRAHQFTLALDYISLAEVATFGDIKAVFSHFGIDTNETRLKQLFFTLIKADLVTMKRYGGYVYYLPRLRNQRWISYRGISGNFHRSRASARIFSSRSSTDQKKKVHDLVFIKGDRRW